jgi:Ca2+-binding RTX toxin-like protein
MSGVIVTLALLAGATPAAAATARVEFRGDPRSGYDVLVFTAAPGERNDLTMEKVGPTLTVRDAGAAISPGRGCTAVPGGVNCAAYLIDADLGDQDDVATDVGDLYSSLDGGAGNDRLSGGAGMTGGPGEDVLTGPGPFADEDGATPAHDVYAGTGGSTLSYWTRATGVVVDLRAGRAGEDTVSGVSSIDGGNGDDVLIGDDGPNTLNGGRGLDRIKGLGGNDTLQPGTSSGRGKERVDGGPGSDTILGSGRSIVRCGPDADEAYGSMRTYIAADCETVDVDPGKARLVADLASENVAFLTLRRCFCETHTFRAFVGRTVVARARGKKFGVRLRLNADGRRLLRRTGRLDVTIATRDGHIFEGFRTRLRLRE